MTATINGRELEIESEELAHEGGVDDAAELATASEPSEEHRAHAPLPWIGALPNFRVGPMVVINDGGYLVPLCTAEDLLRGCRYFWRTS